MQEARECYYFFLDLHGPEIAYQPLFEVLHQLHANQLEYGFPIWWFSGERKAHDRYWAQIEAALPGCPIDEPEIRYCFVFMSSSGYTSGGEYKPITDEQ